jgi:hypothetical protein
VPAALPVVHSFSPAQGPLGPGDKFRGKISGCVWNVGMGTRPGSRAGRGLSSGLWIIVAFSLCKGTTFVKRSCTVQRITTGISFCCCLRGKRRHASSITAALFFFCFIFSSK